MSFNPTEMLQRIRLQNQIQNSQQIQIKNSSPQYPPYEDTQNQNNQNNGNNYNNNQSQREPNFIPANPNSIYYLNQQNNRNQIDDRQLNESRQSIQRSSYKNQFNQYGESDPNRGKVHIQISSDMIDNERTQIQDSFSKLMANNSSQLDSQLIENLILKIQKLEGQVFNLTSNLQDATSSVSDLVSKKKELEDELSHQIAKQIEEKEQRQSHGNYNYPNKAATFGRAQEIDKNETTYSIVINPSQLSSKDRKQPELANKSSSIQLYDDFQMHAISEQMSEDDEDQKSRITFAKRSQIVEESVKNFDEEIVQLRLQNTAKMESIADILKKKGKSPLKIADQGDIPIKEESQKSSYNLKQYQQDDSNRKSFQQYKNTNNINQQSYKENMSSQYKRRDSDLSKSPLSQSQVLNRNQRSQKAPNEENLLNSQKFSQKSIKESRLNTSTTPTRHIEKPIGRLNLDLLANLVKSNPCLNRPILTIKMDDNLFN